VSSDVHEKRIEIRWRDSDAFGHVNNAVYLTYLEEVRDEWLAGVLDAATVWAFVLARVAIDFRRELVRADDEIVAACRLDRIGRSSVTTRETLRVAGDGALAAESESVLVARDRESGASRPLTEAERAAFEGERSG
jgi:acyl-CoA thioester hydrolase